MDQEELSEEQVDAIKGAFEAGGFSKLGEYLESQTEKWKNIPLSIAVTGSSGVGKSCFINSLRNVKRGEASFAKEDVIETTTKPTAYKHPMHPSLTLWDLPGIGTEAFPKEKYFEKVNFEKYDFFLILSSQRFTENDHWLAREVIKAKKKFFFVRTQIDLDVTKRDDLKAIEVVEKVRKNCLDKLKSYGLDEVESKLFLINNKMSNTHDFDRLTTKLIETFPTEKRDALALSLTTSTTGVMKAKKAALQGNIRLYAIASAAGAAIPIPGTSTAVDIAIIFGAATKFRKQFGLDDQTMEKNAKKLGTTKENLKKTLGFQSFKIASSLKSFTEFFTSFAILKCTKVAWKVIIPLIGSVLAAGVSYVAIHRCLTKLLNIIFEDAVKLNGEMMRMMTQFQPMSNELE